MDVKEYIFRAYDVRGIFNVDFNAEIATRLGYAFGTFLGGDAKVVVGRDGRTSSKIIELAFISGLASTGCEVYATGLLPIPTFNFKVLKSDVDAGAYVTASHNPPEYNGIRFRHSDGTGYTWENEEIKKIFFSNKFKLSSWKNLGDNIIEIDNSATIKEYNDFLLSRFNIEKELKVVLDFGNGVTSLTAPYILRKLNAKVITLNAQVDGTFPARESEPTKESLRDLAKVVEKSGADFGAGYDGDGDRVVFVDDKGRIAQTEKIGIIIVRELIKKRKAPVVANVQCSMIVEQELGKDGVEVKRVRVGDVFIAEALKKYNAIFGMEISAHYFMPEFYYFDDPVLITLKLAEILSKSDRKLSELLDEIPSYPMKTMNIRCADEIKFKVMEEVINILRSQGYSLDLTDGAKVIFEDGWALMRPSNTSPLIRVSIEAKSEERLKELEEFVRKTVKEAKKKYE